MAEDDTLYVETSYCGEPVYTRIYIGESPDYANRQGSLNGFQTYVPADGVQVTGANIQNKPQEWRH